MTATIDLSAMTDPTPIKDVNVEYSCLFVVSPIVASKASDENNKHEKRLYEVSLTTYVDSKMLANMMNKVDGHYLRMRF